MLGLALTWSKTILFGFRINTNLLSEVGFNLDDLIVYENDDVLE